MRAILSEINQAKTRRTRNHRIARGLSLSVAKRLAVLAAIVTLLAFLPRDASAAVLIFDVSGIESVGDFADPENETRQIYISPGAHITGIAYDVELSAFGTSWLSEFMVDVSESSYTTGAYVSPGWGTDAPGLNAHYSRDLIPLADYGLDFYLGSDGILLLTFREASDDPGVNPDGLWVSGTLSIEYTPVPEPTSALLAISGIGFALLRRRSRRASLRVNP